MKNTHRDARDEFIDMLDTWKTNENIPGKHLFVQISNRNTKKDVDYTENWFKIKIKYIENYFLYCKK